MQDKQLKSLDKTQLLSIMLSQELEIERLKTEKDHLEKQPRNIADAADTQRLESVVQTLEVELQMLKADKENLENQLFEKQFYDTSAISAAQPENNNNEEIENLNAEIQNLSSVIQSRNNDIQTRDAEILALNAELQSRDENIQSLKSEIQSLNNEAQPMKTEIQTLKSEILELNAEIQSLNAEILELKADNEKLEQIQISEFSAQEQSVSNPPQDPASYAQTENVVLVSDVILIQSLKDEIRALKTDKEDLEQRLSELRERPASAASDSSDPVEEVTLSVSGIIKSAQESAQSYLQNIKRLEEEKTSATQKAYEEAQEKADEIIKSAMAKCDEFEEEEKKSLETLQNISDVYMDIIDKAHSSLNSMIQSYRLTKMPQARQTSRKNAENGDGI